METEVVVDLYAVLEALQGVTDNTDELEGYMSSIEESVDAIEEKVASPRLFLETPLDEYTVTEGLLLTIVICIFLKSLWRFVKEGFYWLL